jgi:phosphopantetheinyl transferase (holo-ACP synthase)
LLGNDLVDLADPETEEAALHPRFDARAFTDAERAALARAADRHALRWTLWAAKEAAYKAARRGDAGVRFHPREFVVDGDVVAHASGRYHVAWSRADGALHAVASVKKGSDPFLTRFVAGSRRLAADEDPGASAREQAIRSAAELLGCASSELSVASAARVPQLLRGGAPTGLALSLSHHGAYAGFALAVDEGRP